MSDRERYTTEYFFGSEKKGGWSLLRRLVLTSVAWMAVAFFIGGLLLSNVFEDYVSRKFDERIVAALESLIGSSEVLPNGFVQLTRSPGDQRFEQAYSGWYWQISTEGQKPMRSRSLWDQLIQTDLADPARHMRFHHHMGPDFEDLRVVELDVLFPDMTVPVRYAVAGDVAEMIADVEAFDTLLFYALGALGIIMLVTMGGQLWVVFHPLKNIRKELSAVRTGQAESLEYNYPREIQPLASEVNALLYHNQGVVQRARRHVGNLAHALKTPLSVLRNDAEVKGDDASLRQLESMQRHVDHHLARARVLGRPRLAGARTNVKDRLLAMSRTLTRLNGERVNIMVSAPDDLYFAGEQEDLDEILGNVMENATKWAQRWVEVDAEYDDDEGSFTLCVDDDGPGVEEKDLARMFDHGVRLDESVPGTGLGLAIVSDIVDMVGGTVSAEVSVYEGLSVVITLPRAE